jgi:hypothetical protein
MVPGSSRTANVSQACVATVNTLRLPLWLCLDLAVKPIELPRNESTNGNRFPPFHQPLQLHQPPVIYLTSSKQ